MDWFQRLTGFREAEYDQTRALLEVVDGTLRSKVNGRTFALGNLELVSLAELRSRTGECVSSRPLPCREIVGEAGALHRAPAHAGALFQVASQFNLLEMTSPDVCPEDGVTRYAGDPTQGPACAIAAGAATIYRNYFVPVAGGAGQRSDRQLDGLAEIGESLAGALGRSVSDLWRMRNGYALCTEEGLAAIADHLAKLDEAGRDELAGHLRIGLHWDVEMTDPSSTPPQLVSQAFCSALPVAYSTIPRAAWAPFAILILEAAYEATLRAGILNAVRGVSRTVFLTRLGGGAFGNDAAWIEQALSGARRKLGRFRTRCRARQPALKRRAGFDFWNPDEELRRAF